MVSVPIEFSSLIKAYWRAAEKCRNVCFGGRICFACSQKFIRAWMNSFQNNIGWRYTMFLKKSPKSIVSLICFYLEPGKMQYLIREAS
jgi:hypothetical protein